MAGVFRFRQVKVKVKVLWLGLQKKNMMRTYLKMTHNSLKVPIVLNFRLLGKVLDFVTHPPPQPVFLIDCSGLLLVGKCTTN